MYQNASIGNIKTETFNAILAELQEEGWSITYDYDGFDAWIDYGRVDLINDGIKLKFEWDNWSEGVIEGPEKLLLALKARYSLKKPGPVSS
jgi:YD repeat-containing protein